MNYDDWKTMPPPENPANECAFCGEPCEETFCDKNCKKGYEND